jgi:hypothetical protein
VPFASIISALIAKIMEAVSTTEPSVNLYLSTQRNIAGDTHLNNL